MSDAAERARAVRAGAGLFELPQRGVVRVSGGDALRWLNGMITADVAALDPAAPDTSAAHGYALLLTPIGRIVADLEVVARRDGFWLDVERAALGSVLARLAKYVIADDVALEDASAALARFGVEGPGAPALFERAAPGLASVGAVVADFGWSGEAARQVFVPAARAGEALDVLRAAGGPDLVEGDAEVLEVLRVEAGVPRTGFELGEDVLPPEARLERAISTQKGCYTGQEVIARIASRGQVKHLLVGLRLGAGELPGRAAPIEVDGRRSGEVTSAVRSALAGAIALGFVGRGDAVPGTRVQVGGAEAEVDALPFVPPGSG